MTDVRGTAITEVQYVFRQPHEAIDNDLRITRARYADILLDRHSNPAFCVM